MNDPDLSRLWRELRANPRALAFVPLAEALRRKGELDQAETVLRQGLAHHPGLKSARQIQARVMADRGRSTEAVAILDDLYPQDRDNVPLVTLYLDLLVRTGRRQDALEVLARGKESGLRLTELPTVIPDDPDDDEPRPDPWERWLRQRGTEPEPAATPVRRRPPPPPGSPAHQALLAFHALFKG